MSGETQFWLELSLSNNERQMTLDVCKTLKTKDFDILVKIIDKASKKDIDLSPLAKFLKDDLLTYLCNNSWKITNAQFIVKQHELLQYYEDRKEKGGSDFTAKNDRWPWVNATNINSFDLLFDGHITTTNYVDGSDNGGYVHKKYYAKNQQLGKNKTFKKSSWKNFAGESKTTSEPKPIQKVNVVQLTKAEGKKCRKEIIELATSSDICEAGFKPEFMETLDDKCRSYLHGCSNLQIKLMRTEVAKK